MELSYVTQYLSSGNCGVEVMQQLVEKGADVNTQGREYGNILQAAVLNREYEVVRFLLDKGADVNAQGGMHCKLQHVRMSMRKAMRICWAQYSSC